MPRSDVIRRLEAALAHPGEASSDFDLNPRVILPEGRVLRPSAVLVCVDPLREEVILTQRSARLKHHPGQIAFPGGKQDPGDPTLEACALREAREEIGLPEGAARVLGRLPAHETVTRFTIQPVLAVLETEFEPVAEVGEVAEVFRVPLAHVTDPARFTVQSRDWQGQRRSYFTVPWGPYYIWGATARILRGLAERMK